jgi:hypothetical protein
MSTINTVQIGRSLFRWRKVIAVVVIAEAIISHQMKKQDKKHKNTKQDMMSNVSDILNDLRYRAEDYIDQARKNMKK